MAERNLGDGGSHGNLQPLVRLDRQLLVDCAITGRIARHDQERTTALPMIASPNFTWARRAAWGLAGVLWFFWIAYEDQGLTVISIVAAVIAFAGGLTAFGRWIGDEPQQRRSWVIKGASVGLVAGALIGPVTALLMLVKLGLHAHPVPDFGPEQFLQALSRTIYWAILGTATGAGLGMIASAGQR